jgi:serine/threonine-protein kinase
MNLEDMVERHGPLPPERTVHLLRQVCQALREAHAIGLIHRDIKPSNIIACERGKVCDVAKLLDFGLVKSFASDSDSLNLTGIGALAGSPTFMSPEQAHGGTQFDARSDIYSLGAAAYFLVTGKAPFERESPLAMLHAHAYEALVLHPRFTECVPADLQRVILRCLEKDPDLRYQDAVALEKALAACECSSQWTVDRAEDWWRQQADAAAAPSSPDSRERQPQIMRTGSWSPVSASPKGSTGLHAPKGQARRQPQGAG